MKLSRETKLIVELLDTIEKVKTDPTYIDHNTGKVHVAFKLGYIVSMFEDIIRNNPKAQKDIKNRIEMLKTGK